jgi:hypothetical protein
MAALDQSMGFRDRFTQAMAELKNLLEANPLEWMVHLTPAEGGGPSARARAAAEGIERTREDAKRAEGGDSSGIPIDKLTTSLDKLSKAMEALTAKIDKGGAAGGGGGRRKGGGGAAGEPPDPPSQGSPEEAGEGKPGYVSPWLARSLATNPTGAIQNLFQSWMTGGSGTGAKAPASVLDFMKGSGGTFEPGKALAGNIGGGEGTAASQFMSPSMMTGGAITVLIGSFIKTLSMMQAAAEHKIEDDVSFVKDVRFGRGIGMDWREGTRGTNWAQSRKDINIRQMRDVFETANVGTAGFGGSEWNKAGLMQEAVNTALNSGISNQQMGSLIGAGVRGGTFVMGGGKEDEKDFRKYLESINKWTELTYKNGISSTDSLRIMAEVSQMGQRGLNILSAENRTGILQHQNQIIQGLPRELQQSGGVGIMQELTAAPKGDRQKAQFMSQFLGANGKLNPKADELAKHLLKGQYDNIKKTYGEYADYTIAQILAESGSGSMEARLSMDTNMKEGGVGAPLRQMFTGMSPLNYANLQGAMGPKGLTDRVQLGTGVSPLEANIGKDKVTGEMILQGIKFQEVEKVLSGMSTETAINLKKMSLDTENMSKHVIKAVDDMKNNFFHQEGWALPKSRRDPALNYPGNIGGR